MLPPHVTFHASPGDCEISHGLEFICNSRARRQEMKWGVVKKVDLSPTK